MKPDDVTLRIIAYNIIEFQSRSLVRVDLITNGLIRNRYFVDSNAKKKLVTHNSPAKIYIDINETLINTIRIFVWYVKMRIHYFG